VIDEHLERRRGKIKDKTIYRDPVASNKWKVKCFGLKEVVVTFS